jgi:large subunit ribosomal protein L30
MPSLHVKLVRSWAGSPERHRRTLVGLGLYKVSDERFLPDTAATLGMINKMSHLVTYERVPAAFKATGRRHTQGKKSAHHAGKKA